MGNGVCANSATVASHLVELRPCEMRSGWGPVKHIVLKYLGQLADGNHARGFVKRDYSLNPFVCNDIVFSALPAALSQSRQFRRLDRTIAESLGGPIPEKHTLI